MLVGKVKQGYQNIQRLRHVISILAKHGFGFLINRITLSQFLPFRKRKAEERFPLESFPVKLRLAMEELGPTFIKFGQMLSTRPDLIPQDYLDELKKLQEEVPPFDYQKVEESIQAELGRPVNELFLDFSAYPLASASIAQVHSAFLPTGEKVAVKIQRPGIDKVIEADLSILSYMATLIKKHFSELRLFEPENLAHEFARTIRRELDFTREGLNVDKFARNFADNETVHIPKIYWEFSTRKVLTMEKIEGIKVTDFDKLEKAGLDRKEIALNGAKAVLKQIFIDGFFHGDPHPGNIYILENNVIAFLDFGMVGRLSEETKEQIADLLLAIIHKDSDKMTGILSTMGLIDESVEIKNLRLALDEFIEKYYELSLQNLELGKVVQEFFQIVQQYQIKIPADFILMGKALITTEGFAQNLDPEFNLSIQIKPFVEDLVKRRLSPLRLWREFNAVLTELVNLSKVLPKETRQILKKIQTGKLKIQFEHQGLESSNHTMDRVSNRIAFSIIIAALIIGSSSIIQTGKGILLLGFPVLGISGFLFAALLGIWLLISILRSGKL